MSEVYTIIALATLAIAIAVTVAALVAVVVIERAAVWRRWWRATYRRT